MAPHSSQQKIAAHPSTQVSQSVGVRAGRALRKNGTWLLMTVPALLFLLVFSYLPMVGIIIAFKNYRFNLGIFGSPWIGLKNFEFLFSTRDAWRITSNTLSLNATFITTTLVGGLAVAFLMNAIRQRKLLRIYQSALLFPYVLSWVVVGYFAFAILNANNGWLNSLLAGFGVAPIRWFGEPKYWPTILTVTKLWKDIGFASIIYLAGMVAINPEYYEAGRIDGANSWQLARSITLPLLWPLIIINLLLAVGSIFYADFGLFYFVTRDSDQLYATTDVIDTYVFRALRQSSNLGMAAAVGVYQSLVGFVLVLVANWLVRRIDRDYSLF
ncbi:MAG: ABC transporter permease subunit [Chloroflexota bacterium]|nr:ABC transporter permease subunit [Chloroflexota bacterium]